MCTLGSLRRFDLQLSRLGSDYGGYWIPPKLLSDFDTVGFISVGLGRDISLDISLLEAGLVGVGIDPIEEYVAAAHSEVQHRGLQDKYNLVCRALTPHGSDLVLYPPLKGDSWRNTPNSDAKNKLVGKRFPGVSLPQIIQDFDPRIEQVIVKMDIEGIELEIIESASLINAKIKYLLIEFDVLSQIPIRSLIKRLNVIHRTRKSINVLKKESFYLVKIEEFNFAFIRL